MPYGALLLIPVIPPGCQASAQNVYCVPEGLYGVDRLGGFAEQTFEKLHKIGRKVTVGHFSDFALNN
jgi:hypothetical protein